MGYKRVLVSKTIWDAQLESKGPRCKDDIEVIEVSALDAAKKQLQHCISAMRYAYEDSEDLYYKNVEMNIEDFLKSLEGK